MPHLTVIGGGLGGLSAAVHARLAGFEVDLFEQHSQLGGKAAPIAIAGFRLDPGPSIIILPYIYREIFRQAGRNLDDYVALSRLDPISRVGFGAEDWWDIDADLSQAVERMAERWPRDAKSLNALMLQLDGIAAAVEGSVFAGPIEQWQQLARSEFLRMGLALNPFRNYKQWIDLRFESPLLRSFFYGFPSYSGQTYHGRSIAGLMIPYYMFRTGVWYPQGGIGALIGAFRGLAEELGARLHTGSKVTGARAEGRRIRALEMEGHGPVEVDCLAVNLDASTFRFWLGKAKPKRSSYSYFTLHWGLPRTLPEVLHHTLLVPKGFETGFRDLYDRRTFPQPPIVYLNNPTAIDPGCAPTGHTNLFAVVTSPGREEFGTEEHYAHAEAAVVGILQQRGIDVTDSTFCRRQNPTYFEHAHGNDRGSLYGPDEPERWMGGILPLPNRESDFENVAYAGGSVQPGAGLPMVALSGRFAVEALMRRK